LQVQASLDFEKGKSMPGTKKLTITVESPQPHGRPVTERSENVTLSNPPHGRLSRPVAPTDRAA
jgi:hypothetical protein